MSKLCRTCSTIKPSDEFYPLRNGLHPSCKECVKSYNRERYAGIPGEMQRAREKKRRQTDAAYRAYGIRSSQKFYTSATGRARTLWSGARRRAADRNEVFGLRLATVEAWMQIGVCPVTGYRFILDSNGDRSKNPFAPSLDRIDIAKPYTDTNARLVIWAYNMFKGQMTDEQCFEICLAVIRGKR